MSETPGMCENPEEMDLLGQSALLVAVTSFAWGFALLARNVKNKLFIAFAVLTSLISAWALAFSFEKIWPGVGFYRLHLFLNVWLAPGALVFIQVLVRIQDRLSRWLLDLSVLAAASLSVALLLHLEETNPLVLQAVYFAPALVVLQTLQLMSIDRRLKRGIKRLPKLPTVGFGRRNLIYVGALFVLCTCVMDHVPWMGETLPALGNIGLTAYLFFLSQAISQQRLLNFGALLSRVLVLLAVALTLTGLYSILVAWIENSPGLFFLNSFIASFLILMLLDPLRAMVGYFTQRLLTQKHRRLLQALREAQRKLVGVVDPGALFQAILHTTESVLQPEWGALFVLRRDGTKYRRIRATSADGEGAPSLRELIADHPLLQYCDRLRRRGDLPILLDQIIESEIDRSTSRVQREQLGGLLQGLKALGCNLLLPLIDEDQRILGFLTLRVSGPPEPWGGNWGILSIIYPYYQQAAQTLHSMDVFVRQREKERLATLGEMAAGLAHEIRNPLGAIKGAAQYLDPNADRPESRFLKVIVEETDRLNRVVTQFLDYSKPDALELRPVDLSALTEKSVEAMRPGLPEGVRLEFSPSDGGSTRVEGASEQLQQVFINLIQNSVKALDGRGDGVIRVSVEGGDEGPHGEAVMTVEDNGKGIKRENLDKLFIPFFTTSPSGTGLGLSICQKIVEAHHGRIEVQSEEGRFTRFSVVLPSAR